MGADFSTRIDRRQVTTTKWQTYDEDVLPLWVADMDIAVPDCVQQALAQRITHGVYGYANPPIAMRDTLSAWSQSHYDWTIENEWQHWLPGVVPALHVAAQALCAPDEEVLVLTPIYPPFLKVAAHTQRRMITVPMAEPSESNGQRWTLDIDAMDRAVTPKTRLLLWCHPHNPTGRVFDDDELKALADFIERHDLWVCSDELHCDLILNGTAHRPLAKSAPQIAHRTITLWAASKTFNIAGLTCACAIIPDAGLRSRFAAGCEGWMPSHNVLGMVATEAAYREGEAWRQQLIEHLQSNVALIQSYVDRWPNARFLSPQATYLGWIDLRQANLGDNPQQTLLAEARVALSDGADFGNPGFVRINFGTTNELLEEALQRIDRCIATHQP